MKKVLIISYQFPPLASPGVYRTINLVNSLPELGYNPIVFTLNEDEHESVGMKQDYSLFKILSGDPIVHRGKAYSIHRIISVLVKLRVYRVFWILLYPILWEKAFLWAWLSFKKVDEVFQIEKPDLIYTTSGPFSSMLLGWRLKRKRKAKWVADLRDPFTDSYAWQFPTKIHWYISRVFEKWLFSRPDVLIVNTLEVKRLYESRGYGLKNKIIVINNGY